MDETKLKKGCAAALLIYIVLAVAFYLICGDQLKTYTRVTEMLSPTADLGELTSGTVVEQRIDVKGDVLTGLTLTAGTYGRQNTGRLIVSF